MSFKEFPKWKYAADGRSQIVQNAEAEVALGADWADTPAAFDKPAPKAHVEKEPHKPEAPKTEAPKPTPPAPKAVVPEAPKAPAKPPAKK
jgi:hypothetical protein